MRDRELVRIAGQALRLPFLNFDYGTNLSDSAKRDLIEYLKTL